MIITYDVARYKMNHDSKMNLKEIRLYINDVIIAGGTRYYA